MGLSSIGGSGGSSGGSTGGTTMLVKDVGESMLVPIPFQHTDFTDTGVEITSGQFPQLYSRLNSGAKPVNYSDTGDVGSAIAEVRASTKAAVAAIEANGELLTIHANGVVTASTDGLTYEYRGVMPSLYGITPDLFWAGSTTGNMVVKGTRIIAVSTARGFGAAWYSDDQGANWNHITDSIFSDALISSAPFIRTRPLVATSTHFFYYDSASKRMIRSADGTVWEYVTSHATVTGSFAATYADPSNGTVVAHITTQNIIISSQDSGETWSSVAAPNTATPTGNYVKFNGAIYYSVYVSSNQLFYKSVDGGATWASAGQATSVGPAGMNNLGVAGGKLCCVGTTTFATNTKHITSTNGSTWTLNTSPVQTNGRFPTYFNNQIVFYRDHSAAGLEKPTISTDGLTIGLTAITSDLVMPSAMNGAAIVVTPNRMLAYSSQSTDQFAYTTDGLTWQSLNMPIVAIWYAGCYDAATGKIYMTNTTSTSYFESNDEGDTWEEIQVTIPTCSAASSVPMVCGNVVAFPHTSSTARYPFALSIPDQQGKRTQIRCGGTWSVPAGTTLQRVQRFRDGYYATHSTTNYVNVVQDAIRNTAVGRNIGAVTTAGVFCANDTVAFTANAGTLVYCTQTDLITWTVKTLPLAQTWTAAVQLNNDQFLLLASGSFKALLGDGLSWEVIDMNGISFDDFNNAAVFKGNVYIFSTDKVTKASRSLPSSKRYIPRVVSPVDGFKYVIRAKG